MYVRTLDRIFMRPYCRSMNLHYIRLTNRKFAFIWACNAYELNKINEKRFTGK